MWIPRSAPFGQSFLDGLLRAVRAHGDGHHFAAMLFFQAQRFFQREAVGLVGFKADVGFADPCAAFDNGERRILRGNLFDADSNFQNASATIRISRSQSLKIRDAFVPPKPKEFESA